MPVMSERNLFTRILPGNSMREMNDWPVWLWAVLQRSHILTRSTFLLYSSFASTRDEQLTAGSATTKTENMKAVLCLAVIAAVYCAVEAKYCKYFFQKVSLKY